jgi:Holliday junction resolvase RusA-like endonuclease
MNLTSAEYNRLMASRGPQPTPRAKRFTGPKSIAKAKAREDMAWVGDDCTMFCVRTRPVGSPRMTQRDKWAQRPCVLAYRAFADALRAEAPNLPPASRVLSLKVTAAFATDDASLWGTPYRKKPDADNILKSVMDALWKDDHKLGDVSADRKWEREDSVRVVIWTKQPNTNEGDQR